ncbi:hypothetical protein H0911_27575 [Bacillus sp. HSTU-bmb18]|nr:hypothetical protein [Bacillus cereus]
MIVEEVGEFNAEEFARQLILMVLGDDRLGNVYQDESKTPETKSPNNKE